MCHNISQKKSLEKITGGPCLALCRRRHCIRGCCCGCSCAQQAMVASQSCIMRRPPQLHPVDFTTTFRYSFATTPSKASMRLDLTRSSVRLCKKSASTPSNGPHTHHHFSKKTNSFSGIFPAFARLPSEWDTLLPPPCGRCAVWITGCGVKTQETQNRSIRGLLRYKMAKCRLPLPCSRGLD